MLVPKLKGLFTLNYFEAMLIQFAISRQREFKADAVGAEICGRPLSLANALQKLELGAHRIPMHVAPSAAPLGVRCCCAASAAYQRGWQDSMSHVSTEPRECATMLMPPCVTLAHINQFVIPHDCDG